MKHAILILLSLFAMNYSFADEENSSPKEELQEIIELINSESRGDGLNRLQLRESDLVASIVKSKDAETNLLLGRAYFYAEMDAKAIEAFETTLQIDQSLSDAHFFTGLIYRYSDDLDNAEKSFRDAISVNGDAASYFIELGRTLAMKGDQLAASRVFENALLLDSDSFDANYLLAGLFVDMGDLEGAERHYLAAVEQKPNDENSNYNLGQLYQNTNQYQPAIKQFEKVVELNPNDWRAISKLVQLNEAVNNFAARDSAIESIYQVWRSQVDEELVEQGFYIREQAEIEYGKLFVLEYFELKGERARKFVFKLQDKETGAAKFEVSLGSYDGTNEIARSIGDIGPDARLYHLDGYAPNGSHLTYGFYSPMPTYDLVKKSALEALADEREVISSTIIAD